MIEQTACGVYFIDQFNFSNLCDHANKGDKLSREIVRAVMGFVDQAPKPICAMCSKRVFGSAISDMTIVVMRTDKATLTAWICEDCAVRDDLDEHVERLLREWPEIPRNSIIEIVKKTTLH